MNGVHKANPCHASSNFIKQLIKNLEIVTRMK